MKREGLRRRLALAMVEHLRNHRLSIANAKRYVTPGILCAYQIRRETKLTTQDYIVALNMAELAIMQNPPTFRYAPRDLPAGQRRIKYFLHAPLSQLNPHS